MSNMNTLGVIALLFIGLVLGCNSAKEAGPKTASADNKNAAETKTVAQEPAEDGTIPSGTGVEKEKPADDKGNVQGKAMFNEQPAAGVEVKLCEKFIQYGRGCDGKTFTTKTDENGEYLIKDVPPGTYGALTVRVFNTPFYVFATSGLVSAAKYNIEAGKTFFAPDSHLFKNDLKLTSPKAGGKVPADGMEISWEPYPDAAYYKVSVHGDSQSGAKTDLDFVGRRVDGTSLTIDKPLAPGTYRPYVDAFNSSDRKLSQSSRDIKVTVTAGN
jgi:hypothetical protein